jgi:hypothetical protein
MEQRDEELIERMNRGDAEGNKDEMAPTFHLDCAACDRDGRLPKAGGAKHYAVTSGGVGMRYQEH